VRNILVRYEEDTVDGCEEDTAQAHSSFLTAKQDDRNAMVHTVIQRAVYTQACRIEDIHGPEDSTLHNK
jgi:hypothetical protein